MKFEGIYTPVITPFTDSDDIDEQAFGDAVERLINAGVHGLVVGGTTGEYYVLSRRERIRTFEMAVEAAKGRVSVTAGINALGTDDAIELGLAAKKAKVDAVMLGSPYYAVPTQRELLRHCLAIDAKVDMPVMLYNFPDRTAVPMAEEFMDRIGLSKNFCAIKESSGDVNRIHLLAREYPHIQMSCGMDDQALEFFAWGARSWVCAGSNFLPKEHIALYEACVIEKNFDKGRRIMKAMLPLLQLLEQGGKFVQCIKYGCELEGRKVGGVRKPLRGMDKELKREARIIIKNLRTSIAAILDETKEGT